MFEIEFINRFLITLAIGASAAAVYFLGNRLLLRRARLHAADMLSAINKRPVLLYFSSPTCAPCQTVQRPAIHRLSEIAGEELDILEIDTSVQPELANRWGVLSVPTTYLLDAQGQPRFINHGVTPVGKLLQQLKAL